MWSLRIVFCIVIIINVVNSSCCVGTDKSCASMDIGRCVTAKKCKWKCWFAKTKTKETGIDYTKENKVISDFKAALTKKKKKKKKLDPIKVQAGKDKAKLSGIQAAKKGKIPKMGGEEDIIFSKKLMNQLNKIKSNADYVKAYGIIAMDSRKITQLELSQHVVQYFESTKPKLLVTSKTGEPDHDHIPVLIRQTGVVKRRLLELADVENDSLSYTDHGRNLLALSPVANLNNLPYSNVGQLWHQEWYDFPYHRGDWRKIDIALQVVVDAYKDAHAHVDPPSAEDLREWFADDEEEGGPSNEVVGESEYHSGYTYDELDRILITYGVRFFNRGSWLDTSGVGTIIKRVAHPTEVNAFYYYILTAAHCLYSVDNTLNKQRRHWKFVRINADTAGFQAGSVLLDAEATAGDVKGWLPYAYQDSVDAHSVDWAILRLKKTDGPIPDLNFPVAYGYDANDRRRAVFGTYDFNVHNNNRMKYKENDEFEKDNYMLWKVPNGGDYKSGMSGTAIFSTAGNDGSTPDSIIGIYNGRDSLALHGNNGLAARITNEKAWAITKILNGDWDIIADVSQAHDEYMNIYNNFYRDYTDDMDDMDDLDAKVDEYYAGYDDYQQKQNFYSPTIPQSLILLDIFTLLLLAISMAGCFCCLFCICGFFAGDHIIRILKQKDPENDI